MQTSLFSWRAFLRFVAIILLGGMFTYTIINSFVISRDNEHIQTQQLETLTNLLISQAALSATDIIANDDQDNLLKLANQIASDELVFDATIYNAEGIKLVASDDAKDAREILGLDTPLKTASIGREQLVKPIFHEDTIIGFMRITFEKGKVTAISDHRYRNSDHLMYMMLILSFIGGILLCLLLLYKPKDQVENILLKDL
ncbi:YtjB family periplasmic protein [Vibrio algivorus]|uniref:Smp protein n=1 Tax=Vibrio algivorus TaxID=1667024 RepID=A0A557PHA1_9VIBR|nr:AhpA/YtjB family protein [Vibrio algivorus]TVO40026.1 SMP protein [Vibrio algivorus]GLT14872.1 smp protein [Vibrio algivorus]